MHHVREHRSLLASDEKRLLIVMARRLPRWMSSDALTLIGLVSMAVAAGAFAAIPRTRWACALFTFALAANWFGDSLDGTLARVRHQPRPRYGYYVDHVIDLAGTTMLIAGMAASGWMHAGVGGVLLAAYFLVAAETYLATHAAGTFRLSFAGFGPTELRIVLACGACYVSGHPWVDIAGRRLLLLDVSALVASVGFVVVFVASAIRTTRELYRAEPLPREGDERAA
jgi:phosphatidylglycerophosphate synthase